MEFLLLGAGIALPYFQELLNKYIPANLRQLTIWGFSLIVATIYVVLKDLDSFSWQYLIGHFAVIATVSNGIFTYLIKPKR